jgi:hypothetical protein
MIVWSKRHPEFPEIRVDRLGRVFRDGVLLPPTPNKHHGYIMHRVRGYPRYAHRLACEAWYERVADKPEVRHLDGSRTNNRPDNLCWGTPGENQRDRLAHGTHNRGKRQWLVKISEDQAREIKLRIAKGQSQTSIAREMGDPVTRGIVKDISVRKAWAYV